jgi:hypothetical protein
VPLDDLLAHREADPRPRVLLAAVQALEDDEDALRVLRIDADAVVLDGKEPLPAPTDGGDVHAGRLGPPELHRVGHQCEAT